MHKETTPGGIIAYARKHRYERAEGFCSEEITFELQEDTVEILDTIAEELSKAAGVSLEDAQSAAMNYLLELSLANDPAWITRLLENIEGGGI